MKWIKASEIESVQWTSKTVARFIHTKLVLCEAKNFLERYPHRLNTIEVLDESPPDEHDPIPLTAEILEKAGWKSMERKHGYEYWFSSVESMWSIRQEGNGKWQFCIIVRDDEIWKFEPILESLHQLQNLYFALTGTELEINL